MTTMPSPTLSLTELLQGIQPLMPAQNFVPQSLSLDSRTVLPGGLFLACHGTAQHGLAFVAQALAKGAAGILYDPKQAPSVTIPDHIPCLAVTQLSQHLATIAERFYGSPSRALRVIGITGTNGKTSCCHFLAQALQPEKVCGVIGTLGNGLYGKLQKGTHTTPDALQIHQLMAEFLAAGASHVVMEVSSHALVQARVKGIAYRLAILSNISRDHLDYHGTLSAYEAAKRKLFEPSHLGQAILPARDDFARRLMAQLPESAIGIAYGIGARPADLPSQWPYLGTHSLQSDTNGLHIALFSPWGEGIVRSPLLGRFNAENLLAVLAALLLEGLAWSDALLRLAKISPIAGRMERFGGHDDQPLVIVDYAHTPDALEKALRSIRPTHTGHLNCVFGCGGERDQGKRALMGEVAEQYSDSIVLTDDNPRHEDGADIIAGILQGIRNNANVAVQRDRRRALQQAIRSAKKGDVVLIAGKGHESYQQIGSQYLPLDDRTLVREALAERAGEA